MVLEMKIFNQEENKYIQLYFALKKDFPELAHELVETSSRAQIGVEIRVVPIMHKTTQSQRNYYWKCVKEFSDFCGTTPDEMHEHILCECFGSEIVETRIGSKRRPIMRSSRLNKLEYSELIERLIYIASDYGFSIPPPLMREE